MKKMATIEQSLKELNNLIVHGKAMDAFDKFYADDVIMQENEELPTIGKEANRLRELLFYGNLTEVRKAQVLSSAVGDNISYVTWHYDYTHKDWGERNYTQVAVQTWKDGKIVKEQFFYGN